MTILLKSTAILKEICREFVNKFQIGKPSGQFEEIKLGAERERDIGGESMNSFLFLYEILVWVGEVREEGVLACLGNVVFWGLTP